MLRELLSFLLDALVQPYAALLLLRFHAVWLRAPLRNPVGEFLMALTDFVVLRVRRFVPALRSLDSSTLLLALLVEYGYLSAYWAMGYSQNFPWAGLLVLAAVKLLRISIYLLMISLIAEAVLSWVNPYTPLAPMLAALNGPFVQPLRRRIPPVGSVDLSGLLVLLLCQLMLIVPLAELERLALGLL